MSICRCVNLSEAGDFLRAHDQYVILTHASPDGDTLGSAFGLKTILNGLGKTAVVVCPDPIPQKYLGLFADSVQPALVNPTAIAIDVADESLLGGLKAQYTGKVSLCFDHHKSNSRYARLLYLDESAAAAAECIFDLALALNVPIDQALALPLYVGLSTDTGCFRYASTTPKTLRTAAALIETGIDSSEINRLMFESKSRARVKLEGLVFAQMDYFYDGRCAVACITRDMMQTTGCTDDDLEGINALSRVIEGVVVGITLREKQNGRIKVSVRSHPPVDACELCAAIGGGGHARAAGGEFKGSLRAAKETMVSLVGAFLEKDA